MPNTQLSKCNDTEFLVIESYVLFSLYKVVVFEIFIVFTILAGFPSKRGKPKGKFVEITKFSSAEF